MKSFLHAPNSAKVAEAEALQRICPIREEFSNFWLFLESWSHGLIQSSYQAFHYAELCQDQSKDGFHLAASVVQNS